MKSKPELSKEHEDSRDGRKVDPQSSAPYGTEEHLNEELTKQQTIEKATKSPEPEKTDKPRDTKR